MPTNWCSNFQENNLFVVCFFIPQTPSFRMLISLHLSANKLKVSVKEFFQQIIAHSFQHDSAENSV
jgi:hypothetical protein